MMFIALSFYGIFTAYLSYEEVMSVRIYAQYAPTIIFIIFLDFLMFYQVFFSPQVKRCGIITYKHGTYDLPHE